MVLSYPHKTRLHISPICNWSKAEDGRLSPA